MAYERTWQFMPVYGPWLPAANYHTGMQYLWILKNMLRGELGTAVSGLWNVYYSCDGTTAGTAGDGVDRWGTTYTLPGINDSANAPGGPKPWMVLTRSIGGVTVYLTLKGSTAGGTLSLDAAPMDLSYIAPTGGNATTLPTVGTQLWITNLPSSPTYNSDVTSNRRNYGGVTTLGDFWFVQTVGGDIEHFVLLMAPVGCKVNDNFPIYATGGGYTAGNASGNVAGSRQLFAALSAPAGRFYNGAIGYPFLVGGNPYAHLDSSDVSLYDFPTWVVVGNSTTPTALHARGRLPDIGISASIDVIGQASSRPCALGTTIRDGGNNVVYVTLNQMIVPYNNLVS